MEEKINLLKKKKSCEIPYVNNVKQLASEVRQKIRMIVRFFLSFDMFKSFTKVKLQGEILWR